MSVTGPAELERPETDPESSVSPAPMDAGRFITFEGVEGTGKTTQIARLATKLTRAGLDVVITREPGGTALGRELRAVLLRPSSDPLAPEAELLLYVTDRAQHLLEVVEPAIERGAVVLCDRYADATLAYQGYGRGLDIDWIRSLHRRPPLDRRPHRTLLFDLDPVLGLARAHRRNRDQDLAETEGRFEDEDLDFHRRVREGYLELAAADPERIRIIDAREGLDDVEQRVSDSIADLLPLGEEPC